MKFKLLILIFSILSVLISAKSAEAAVIVRAPASLGLISGLVGHWTFDGGSPGLDRSGSGNHGTLTNGPKIAPGKIGQALDFDGTDDYVDVGDPIAGVLDFGSATDFTLSSWVKTSGSADIQAIIEKRVSTGNVGYILDIRTTNKINLFVSTASNNISLAGTTVLMNNTWYHVSAVLDRDGNATIYLNGAIDGSTSMSAVGDINNTGKFIIGKGNINDISSALKAFDGVIDDVRIYNRALSPSEVQRLYKIGGTLKLGAANTTGSLQTGLVGHWTFDGGSPGLDRSGQGNHGTLTNGPKIAPGKIGQALDFDGTDDYVDIGSQIIGSGAYTFSSWIKPDALATTQRWLVQDGIDTGDFLIRINDTSGHIRYLRHIDDGNDTFEIWDTTSLALVTNKWQHVVIVFDGSNARIYLDGVGESPAKGTGAATTGANTFLIGRYNGSNQFNGAIDDVRIYNRALTGDEIKRLYRSGATLKLGASNTSGSLTSGLVGHWTFDGPDMNATKALDRSGQGFHGTLTGGPKVIPGKIGQALSFDGTDDYTNNGVAIGVDTKDFIVSAWVKTTQAVGGSIPMIVSKRDASAGTNIGYQLFQNGSSGTLSFDMSDGSASRIRVDSTGPIINDGAWHHVSVTFDRDGNANAYVDGVPAPGGSASISSQPGSLDNILSFRIGAEEGGFYWNGQIDDVRIYYNRVLSADEIKRLYNLGR